MKRGDVVIVATGSGFGGKPRPALILQSDSVVTQTFLVALFTSDLTDAQPVRPLFHPSPENGLTAPSELMADVLVTARREKIGAVVGRLSVEEMARAERAVIAVLGLGR